MAYALRTIAFLVIAAVVAFVGGTAHASFIPYGPQQNVLVSTVENDWGWTPCYSAPFSTPIGNDPATGLTACTGSVLMVAGMRTGSDTFSLLAAADRSDVFFNTGYGDGYTTHVANGSEWYYAPSWSWGFAGIGDTVNKFSCDVASGDDANRLCIHTITYTGGYRVGAFTGLNDDSSWTKVVLQLNETPVPAPGALALLGFGLVGLGRLRRRK